MGCGSSALPHVAGPPAEAAEAVVQRVSSLAGELPAAPPGAAPERGARRRRRTQEPGSSPPVRWEQLDRRETAEENRKLRGELQRLEGQLSSIRGQLDDQLQHKEDQLLESTKHLSELVERDAVTAGRGRKPRPKSSAGQRLGAMLEPAIAADGSTATAWVVDNSAAENAAAEMNDDLRLFAQLGEVDAVRLRIVRGADIDDADDEGNTALLLAVRKNHTEIVQLLLRQGADMSVVNRFRQTVLSEAVRLDLPGIVGMLIQAGVETATASGYSALFEAARLGRPAVTHVLLQQPAEAVDARNMLLETPVTVAIRSGHVEVFKVLVEHGADLSATDRRGRTPLMVASENGRAEAVETLLKKGASVNQLDGQGHAAILYASRNSQLACVRLLLDHGATAFSHRDFKHRLYQQPARGSDAFRRQSGSVLHGVNDRAAASRDASYSVAARVPAKKDDLPRLARWSAGEVTGLRTISPGALRVGDGGRLSVDEAFVSVRPESNGRPDSRESHASSSVFTVDTDPDGWHAYEPSGAAATKAGGRIAGEALACYEAVGPNGLMPITEECDPASAVIGQLVPGQIISLAERNVWPPPSEPREKRQKARGSQARPALDVEAASLRIQSVQRGRIARRRATVRRKRETLAVRQAGTAEARVSRATPEEQERIAAVRIQSAQRGRIARQKAASRKRRATAHDGLAAVLPSRIRVHGGGWVSDIDPSTGTQLLQAINPPLSAPARLQPIGKQASAPNGKASPRDAGPLVARADTVFGEVTQVITRTSAGSAEYQQAKLRLLGLVFS